MKHLILYESVKKKKLVFFFKLVMQFEIFKEYFESQNENTRSEKCGLFVHLFLLEIYFGYSLNNTT